MTALSFDTSNYTTSTAFYGDTVKNVSRLLPVREGALGLRQSDAVFSHINAIYDLLDELYSEFDGEINAVGVSYAPRRVDGSYMPCFKVGETVAKSIARVLGVPCHLFSHQEGHLAAALFTTGNENERSGMGFTIMESFMDKIKVVSKVDRGTKVTLTKILDSKHGV